MEAATGCASGASGFLFNTTHQAGGAVVTTDGGDYYEGGYGACSNHAAAAPSFSGCTDAPAPPHRGSDGPLRRDLTLGLDDIPTEVLLEAAVLASPRGVPGSEEVPFNSWAAAGSGITAGNNSHATTPSHTPDLGVASIFAAWSEASTLPPFTAGAAPAAAASVTAANASPLPAFAAAVSPRRSSHGSCLVPGAPSVVSAMHGDRTSCSGAFVSQPHACCPQPAAAGPYESGRHGFDPSAGAVQSACMNAWSPLTVPHASSHNVPAYRWQPGQSVEAMQQLPPQLLQQQAPPMYPQQLMPPPPPPLEQQPLLQPQHYPDDIPGQHIQRNPLLPHQHQQQWPAPGRNGMPAVTIQVACGGAGGGAAINSSQQLPLCDPQSSHARILTVDGVATDSRCGYPGPHGSSRPRQAVGGHRHWATVEATVVEAGCSTEAARAAAAAPPQQNMDGGATFGGAAFPPPATMAVTTGGGSEQQYFTRGGGAAPVAASTAAVHPAAYRPYGGGGICGRRAAVRYLKAFEAALELLPPQLQRQQPRRVVGLSPAEQGDALLAAARDFERDADAMVHELFRHVGFTEAQAQAAIAGPLDALSMPHQFAASMVIRLKRDVVELYARHLRDLPARLDGAYGRKGGNDDGHRHAMMSPAAVSALAAHVWLDRRIAIRLLGKLSQTLRSSICQLWAMANIVDPHPNKSVKTALATYSGKTPKQIADWFTNWRARHWRPNLVGLAKAAEAKERSTEALSGGSNSQSNPARVAVGSGLDGHAAACWPPQCGGGAGGGSSGPANSGGSSGDDGLMISGRDIDTNQGFDWGLIGGGVGIDLDIVSGGWDQQQQAAAGEPVPGARAHMRPRLLR